MDDEDPLRPPARQLMRSQHPLPQIDEIGQELFPLRGTDDARHPVPLEVAHGANPAMRPNPPKRRLGPLIGAGRSQSSIDPVRMCLKVIRQGNGGADALGLDFDDVGFATHNTTQVANQPKACGQAIQLRKGAPQIVWERGVCQLGIERFCKRDKLRTPLTFPILDFSEHACRFLADAPCKLFILNGL